MLSNEDKLRLQVLLRQDVNAIRIDESKMIVYALTARGEGKVVLNPTSRDEQYLREIRELFSNHYLGSPGGYPVFIHRWTRMTQSRSDESLANLLKLGEPEAVVAVANASGISAEVARRAWWALPNEEMARALLRHDSVISDALGQELARFLYEFLPFEAEPARIVENVRLLLQPGLLNDEECQSMWTKASHKSAYYPGFLMTRPDDLPIDVEAHADFERLRDALAPLVESGNHAAVLYLKLHDNSGRGFMQGIRLALKRPSSQDSVIALFQAIGQYFDDLGLVALRQREIRDIRELAEDLCKGLSLEGHDALCRQLGDLLDVDAVQVDRVEAMLALAQLGESVLDPLFGGTDTLGTAMRRHIKPLTEPVLELITTLEQP